MAQLKGSEYATLDMAPNHYLFDSVKPESLGKKSLLVERRNQLEQAKTAVRTADIPTKTTDTPTNTSTNAPVLVHLNFGEIFHALQGNLREHLGFTQAACVPVAPAADPLSQMEPMLLSVAQLANLGPRLSLPC